MFDISGNMTIFEHLCIFDHLRIDSVTAIKDTQHHLSEKWLHWQKHVIPETTPTKTPHYNGFSNSGIRGMYGASVKEKEGRIR